jgi:SAM-dependent methyltransferase
MSSDLVQKFYEDWHTLSKDERSFRESLIDRDIMSLKYIMGSNNILEIGCGTGTLLDLITGKRVCGVDISKTAIHYAVTKGIEGYVVDIDRQDLPFKDNEFDGILCVEVLEHLFDPVHALAEANRVLDNGAKLVVTVPNIGYYQYRLLHLFGTFTDLHGNGLVVDEHIRFYTQASMRKLIETCGFTIKQIKGAMKRKVPIPTEFRRDKKSIGDKSNASLFPRTRDFFKNFSILKVLGQLHRINIFNLYRIWPSAFAIGLVFECVKTRPPKYKYNYPVDHTKRTDEQYNTKISL